MIVVRSVSNKGNYFYKKAHQIELKRQKKKIKKRKLIKEDGCQSIANCK